MKQDEFMSRRDKLLSELGEYIGVGYLSDRQIIIGDATRFDQLNFDIVDEVVVEHMIDRLFGFDGFTCDNWPDTVGELISVIGSRSYEFASRKHLFMSEFEDYIGHVYLSEKRITLDDGTRFDRLNFDMVDEVVTEHMIDTHFGLYGFTCDTWPETLGDLLELVRSRIEGSI